MGVSNNCWQYLSRWSEGFSNVVKIFSCIIFEINVLWTLIIEGGCSMCNGSIGLLHVNMWNCEFSCECYSRECVCGMSLRPTFVFVDISMLFKQELIFFTKFTFFLWRWCKWKHTLVNLNSKVELLIRNLFVISYKVEDGNVIIKFNNCSLCMGFQWKCLGFFNTFSCDTSFFCFCGCILSSIPYKDRNCFWRCLMGIVVGWLICFVCGSMFWSTSYDAL